MMKSLLVPVDGSAFGEHALPLASTLARRAGAELHVVHVHVPQIGNFVEPTLYLSPGLEDSLRKQKQIYLDDLAKRLNPSGQLNLKTTLLEGDVEKALEEHAEKVHADLVLMTTHGRGTLSRAWLGSVADDMVRRLAQPILLLRPHEQTANLTKETVLGQILVGLDGSPLAEQILPTIRQLAELMHSRLLLVRIIRPMVLGHADVTEAAAWGMSSALLEQLQTLYEKDRAEAVAYLDRIASGLRTDKLKVTTRVVGHEQPSVALLEEADMIKADLIALATHGRSGLPRLFLGSVADKVVRGAHCPVLVQRPKKG